MKKISVLFLLLSIMTSCKETEKDQTIVERIAEANGIESFQDIEELRYTFNVMVNDSLRTSRAWKWRPKDKVATLTTPDSTVTYNYETQAAQRKTVDQQFINDQYWLLFPYHLVWDDMEWEHTTNSTSPISEKQMHRITVTYPDGAGYTPGDVYEIFFEDDFIIREWVYLSGGSRDNLFATTWEDYEEYQGIPIAKMHKSKDGSFKLFFSDIRVTKSE